MCPYLYVLYSIKERTEETDLCLLLYEYLLSAWHFTYKYHKYVFIYLLQPPLSKTVWFLLWHMGKIAQILNVNCGSKYGASINPVDTITSESCPGVLSLNSVFLQIILTTGKYCEWTQDSCINTHICRLKPRVPEVPYHTFHSSTLCVRRPEHSVYHFSVCTWQKDSLIMVVK